MRGKWPDVSEMEEAELHAAAVASGVIYEDRPAKLKWISRVGYEFRMMDHRPPARLAWSDGAISNLWLEWYRVRGLDPYKPPSNRRLSARLRELIIQRDGYVCGLCGSDVAPADVHIDHIHPRALGGSDDPSNLQVAHSFCNISKGARSAWSLT